jgi:hypothetical protein
MNLEGSYTLKKEQIFKKLNLDQLDHESQSGSVTLALPLLR